MRVGLIPTIADPRTIAVDLDDTLNNFTETLQSAAFPYDAADSLSEATFERYLRQIRNEDSEPGDLLSTGYAYCRFKIHLSCYQQARARPDGAEFMRWLRSNRWRIVICTKRDLRRSNDCTKVWLKENDIPFDYLFMASNKIVFCKAWGIRHLVDDALFSIVHGEQFDINVYYPIVPVRSSLPASNARGFQTFEDVKRWIQE
jgi:hypothetical protein